MLPSSRRSTDSPPGTSVHTGLDRLSGFIEVVLVCVRRIPGLGPTDVMNVARILLPFKGFGQIVNRVAEGLPRL